MQDLILQKQVCGYKGVDIKGMLYIVYFVQTSSNSSLCMTIELYRRADIRQGRFICGINQPWALFQFFKHYEYDHKTWFVSNTTTLTTT